MRQKLPRSLTLCCVAAALVFAVSGCAPLPPQGNAAPHHAKAQAAHDALHPMARAALAQPALSQPQSAQQRQQWLDRVTWGGSDNADAELQRLGLQRWLAEQLRTDLNAMPEAAVKQIGALSISQMSMTEIQQGIAGQRLAIRNSTDADERARLTQDVQRRLNQLTAETQKRQLLRALYSPQQLQEQMTWFWMNHFNVSTRKGETRMWIGDYEERAVRPNALGNFRNLLEATMRHPAMQLYLDNASNAVGRINENYARELLELHTMGVGSGYTQADVQAMAHVLTGVGYTVRGNGEPPPKIRPERQRDYVRDGFFEFNPNRHDYTPQAFLGRQLAVGGMAQVDEALDRIVESPATAHFIAKKLAVFFINDNPPQALVERTAKAFATSHGDIPATLATLLTAPEALQTFGQRYKDPMHYVVGAVRLAYDQRVASDVAPAVGWINRMGQPLYGHETPDGYPLTQTDWASSGQMTTRFDIARQIATRGAVLFKADPKDSLEKPPYPDLAQRASAQARLPLWSEASRNALLQAKNAADWNTYFLSAPEWMFR